MVRLLLVCHPRSLLPSHHYITPTPLSSSLHPNPTAQPFTSSLPSSPLPMAARCRRVTMTDGHVFIYKPRGQAFPVALRYMHAMFIDEAILWEPPGEEGADVIFSASSKAAFCRHGEAWWTIVAIGLCARVCTVACCHRRSYFAVLDVAVASRSVDCCCRQPCPQRFQIDGRCAVKSVGNQQRPRCSPQEIMKTHGGVKMEARRKYPMAGLTTGATEEMNFQVARKDTAQSVVQYFQVVNSQKANYLPTKNWHEETEG